MSQEQDEIMRELAGKVLSANLKNIAKKVMDGKTLTAAEKQTVEEAASKEAPAAQPPASPNPPKPRKKKGDGDEDDPHKLSHRQRIFVTEYIKHWNIKRAAEKAGYGAAQTSGCKLLTYAKVKAAIKAELDAAKVEAEQILIRWRDIGFSDISEFLKDDGTISLEAVKAKGYVLKEYDVTAGVLRLKDDAHALQMLAKSLGMLKDRVEHSGADGGPIGMIVVHSPQFDPTAVTGPPAVPKVIDKAKE